MQLVNRTDEGIRFIIYNIRVYVVIRYIEMIPSRRVGNESEEIEEIFINPTLSLSQRNVRTRDVRLFALDSTAVDCNSSGFYIRFIIQKYHQLCESPFAVAAWRIDFRYLPARCWFTIANGTDAVYSPCGIKLAVSQALRRLISEM